MGSIMNKYKVNELAKDFGLQTRQIIEILGRYFDVPKKSGQNLDEKELAIVFEYLTQHNQVSGLQVIFADAAPAEKPAPAPQPAPQAAAQRQGDQPRQDRRSGQQQPQGGQQRPQQGQQQAKGGQAAPQTQQAAPRGPKTKVVDTRKATNVNLAKYDEKLQDLAERSSGGMRDMDRNKEKFRGGGKKRGSQPAFSNKRRQEEAEKMRRLQLEIAKKTPLTVKIPPEISVGELASRMKKTGAEVVSA